MSTQFELAAELRSNLGKGASRRLRRENKVPAIMYGADLPPAAITLQHHHVLKALENEAFYSHILQITVGEEKFQAVLKDLQRHAFKPKILHMDFLRINPKEKITMSVPLHFIGETAAPGFKQGGVFMHLLTSVEIRCLPAHLPEFISVDVSTLNLDETLHLTDIKLPEHVELTAFLHGGTTEEHNAGVVKIHIPRAAVEEETPVSAPEATSSTAKPAAATADTKASKK